MKQRKKEKRIYKGNDSREREKNERQSRKRKRKRKRGVSMYINEKENRFWSSLYATRCILVVVVVVVEDQIGRRRREKGHANLLIEIYQFSGMNSGSIGAQSILPEILCQRVSNFLIDRSGWSRIRALTPCLQISFLIQLATATLFLLISQVEKIVYSSWT